ncbi:hypothetical protein WAI453_006279 [Rhynchosporium graminicola]|uniref:Cyclase n=1 Tax=Rhynchosporium graminicola TaxID=2792576 RepID=A0A1E1L796_9HELO|nr:uncharacterized protein RCO7_03307 [Rhynchosporium commune]
MLGPSQADQTSKVTSDKETETPRYDSSIYDTPFSKLPNPKRVWLGSPSSSLEGLGRLTLLTPPVVSSAASSEIKTGRRVGLGWDMTKLEHSQFGRQKCGHTIIPLTFAGGAGLGAGFDDKYDMNPQQSSQWDGFRHYSQPRIPGDSSNSADRVFYGGTTKEEIMDTSDHRIGLQHWASEGIAGRGVFLDYQLWASSQSPPITYTNFSTHAISFAAIQAMLTFFNITPQKGDILLVRMGVIPEWDAFTSTQKVEYAAQKEPQHAGVEACAETLEWLWDSGFAAVAGDAISWEVYPTPGAISVHEYLLAGWGMPIGELFDLEALSKICKELNRYSFFLTSMPLNMPGGVSSPPNAMAIF